MPAQITLQFVVPLAFRPGDTVRLYSNGGSGVINWTTPHDNAVYDCFPEGAGVYGWGHAPWGRFPWGHAYAQRTRGWGHLPWGHFPWGLGATLLTIRTQVQSCGEYLFALGATDAAGNAHVGTPDELALSIHLAPAAPAGLKFVSYDPDADLLILAPVR